MTEDKTKPNKYYESLEKAPYSCTYVVFVGKPAKGKRALLRQVNKLLGFKTK